MGLWVWRDSLLISWQSTQIRPRFRAMLRTWLKSLEPPEFVIFRRRGAEQDTGLSGLRRDLN